MRCGHRNGDSSSCCGRCLVGDEGGDDASDRSGSVGQFGAVILNEFLATFELDVDPVLDRCSHFVGCVSDLFVAVSDLSEVLACVSDSGFEFRSDEVDELV